MQSWTLICVAEKNRGRNALKAPATSQAHPPRFDHLFAHSLHFFAIFQWGRTGRLRPHTEYWICQLPLPIQSTGTSSRFTSSSLEAFLRYSCMCVLGAAIALELQRRSPTGHPSRQCFWYDVIVGSLDMRMIVCVCEPGAKPMPAVTCQPVSKPTSRK